MAQKKKPSPRVPVVSLQEVADQIGWGAIYRDEQAVVAIAMTPRQIRGLLETLAEVHDLREYSSARDRKRMSTVLEAVLREAILPYRS